LDKETTYRGFPPVFAETAAPAAVSPGELSGIGWRTRLALAAQVALDWIFLLPFAGLIVVLMRWAGGYRIENRAEIRRRFREITRDKTPLLICLNHLTFIDSALLMWAMASNPWYVFHFRCFSWNLPAGDFFKKKLIYRVVALFSKCIFIHRDGSRDHKYGILSVCRFLLTRGEVVSIFPEGKRSRSGRFEPEKVTFGVGKILESLPDCRVLCVYIRGDRQKTWSNYPPRGSKLHISMDLITPRTDLQGREAHFDLTMQIARNLKRMEDEYFLSRPAPQT
jgi:1-acyl-sn-glycerol-3-phosphate acyltransferase